MGVGAAALACSSGGPSTTCVAGTSQLCACTDGRMGAQVCLGSGVFDSCTCTGGTAGGSGGGGGSAGGAPSGKRIFLTSVRHPAATLGGVTGADAKCQTAAQGANLGGTWKAWLSDATTNAIDRIAEVGPWLTLEGPGRPSQIAFNNKANLATQPFVDIEVTEQGMAVIGLPELVWTGTATGGMRTTLVCTSWSMNVGAGTVGDANDAADWTNYRSEPCTASARLYCLEQ